MLAEQFIAALERLERDGDLEPMARLYAPDAVLVNPTGSEARRGPDGARDFWEAYRASFRDLRSEMRFVVESERGAAIEWTSRGHGPGGAEVTYDGVSVLEYGSRGIRHFRAYFDPRDLGLQLGAAGPG